MQIQRETEQLAIPTVLITLVPEASKQMGPPRAIHPVGFTLGDCLGREFQPKLQRQVLLDAFKRWEARIEPGVIWEMEYSEYQRDPAIEGSGELTQDE